MKKLLLILFIGFLAGNLITAEIGLALSGGGARGFAHIGVLKVIDEMQIPVDYISGSSIGAVIGGLYAMGYSAAEIEQIILELKWAEILDDAVPRKDLYISQKRWMPNGNVFFELDDNYIPRIPLAFVQGNNLVNQLFELTYPACCIDDFAQLNIPFKCISTNILTGEKHTFSSGPLHEALRASMSFPSVIAPFQLEDGLFIDGGITSNLPVESLKQMGAETIIGIDTSSDLKNDDQLATLIDVLDQTINISMSKNIENSRSDCDYIIEPDLKQIDLLDFNKKKDIIALGEQAARSFFEKYEDDFPKRKKEKRTPSAPKNIRFSQIKVEGNSFLSKRKIKEYLALKTGVNYSLRKLQKSFKKAYDSTLFAILYPVIKKGDSGFELIIKVREKNRKKMGFDLKYNSNREIIAGVSISLNNFIQHNSKLLASLQLGDRNSFKIDYVKNFGKHFGVYYRLFPNITEQKHFSYNELHEKIRSVTSLEFGGTAGIGIFAADAAIVEAFTYGFQKNLYKNIAEFENDEYHSVGIGLKMYHESLDDFVFPMKGGQILLKYNTANEDFFSVNGYRKFYSKIKLLLPFSKRLSLKYKFEYGSYFETTDLSFDPFYVGGFDSFLGLNENELSAPIYKINTLAVRLNPIKNLFCDFQINILNLGNVDYWFPEENLYRGAGITIGYNTLISPFRAGFAINKDLTKYLYFSIGYETDAFEFSGR